jgi:hypothetical protein
MMAVNNEENENKVKLIPNEIIVVVIDNPRSVFVANVIYIKDNTITVGMVKG